MKLTLPCKRFLSVANVVAKSIAPKDTISQTLIKIDENSHLSLKVVFLFLTLKQIILMLDNGVLMERN